MSTDGIQIHALDAVRADGWLEAIGQRVPSFDALRDLVGERFLGFALLTGTRIVSIDYDAMRPNASRIAYEREREAVQHATLGEFRARMAELLLDAPDPTEPLGNAPDAEQLMAYIGPQFVYLAPLFGLGLTALVRHPDGRTSVRVSVGDVSEMLGVEGLRQVLRDAVRDELAHAGSTPPRIDLSLLVEAEQAAARGDHEGVIARLGAWPDVLSMGLRSPEAPRLTEAEHRGIAQAMRMLGEAYLADGRLEWADEVLRLGIQWTRDGAAAAALFQCLGGAYVRAGRHGEAIGLLRRAWKLGAPESAVLPLLADAFAARGRYVGAMACLDALRARGLQDHARGADDARRALRDRVETQLGDAYRRYRAWLEGGSADGRNA